MGLFNGHIVPGAFSFLFGAWWAFSAWRVYILSRLGRRDYLSTASFTIPKLSNRLCRTLAELATAYEDGKFTAMGNTQHTSMYVFYGLSGLADLLTIHEAPVPRGTDYSLLRLAVCAEAFLFHFHLHVRRHLDVLVHTLLIYTLVAEAACIAVVQGTWFFQVAFVLNNPLPNAKPWGDGHQDLMLATILGVDRNGDVRYSLLSDRPITMRSGAGDD
ncbi:hypothetical protein HPB47_006629 [Ixodes persulcatus]|uniref:Uncharacterized protein n=1 Tax=Ixodes persulcatus TaxID=34615 RepID=A0AC60PAQ5_IXOPE|nr:hypothetical protein HPB47_006629 [Ixodes persulcatus]